MNLRRPSTAAGSAALVLCMACDPLLNSESESDQHHSGDAQGGSEWGEVLQWPTFGLDCPNGSGSEGDVPWDGDIDVRQFSGDQFDSVVGFSVGAWPDGAIGPNPRIGISFDTSLTRFDVDREAHAEPWQLELHVQVDNTAYYNRASHQGQTLGEVVVHEFDAVQGTADVEFVGVKILGDDAVYAGDYRCAIDGHLRVVFGRLELGEACREDHECGGDRSMRICDFNTLSCTVGCHDDRDCPLGQTCADEVCT